MSIAVQVCLYLAISTSKVLIANQDGLSPSSSWSCQRNKLAVRCLAGKCTSNAAHFC